MSFGLQTFYQSGVAPSEIGHRVGMVGSGYVIYFCWMEKIILNKENRCCGLVLERMVVNGSLELICGLLGSDLRMRSFTLAWNWFGVYLAWII